MTTQEISLDPDLLKFVTPPPDYLQLKCPICLELLLEDPYLVSCCGYHLCGRCIKNILHQPCSLCKSVSLQNVPDKGFQRALSSLSVFCLRKEEGCVWSGELKQLKQHLSREGDCEYIELTCKHDGCEVVLLRSLLKDHELKCSKRPAICEHCNIYQSTWEDVQHEHLKTCPDVLVPCPNECEASIKRRDVDDHIAQTCLLRKIKCEFSLAGCEWLGVKENLPKHLDICWREHISYMTLYYSKEMKKQDEKIINLSKRVANLEFVNGVIDDVNLLFEKKMISPAFSIEDIFMPFAIEDISLSFTERQLASLDLEKTKENLQFVVDRWHYKRSHNNLHHSPVFHLDSIYKMQVTVHCNGYGSGKGSHVSVYATLLSFIPFMGDLVIRLRNQRTDNHLVREIHFDESTPRLKQVGIPKFVAFQHLDPYLRSRDDGLQFELPQVTII